MKYGISILTLGFLLAIPAGAQTSSNKAQATPGNVGQGQDAEPTTATTDPDYVIGAQDTLLISVWKEPEISANVPVRLDGKISLPLIQDVEAAGKTPMQLQEVITNKFKQYLTDPRVTVIVTGINSKRVFLVGEIGRQGAINMLPNMTALQALASGGAFSQFANLKKIYILRNENGKQIKLPFNYKAVVKGEAPDMVLKPGDTIVVP